MQQPLTIRYSRQTPPREPRAWFLPGGDGSIWLDELLRWQLPYDAVALRIVPRSIGDRAPLGVLATPRETPRNVSPRSQPYACLADRLFLPVEARLLPAVAEEELSRLFSATMSYVWHPLAGLVAFEPNEVLSPADLLRPPDMTESDWSFADPGLSIHRRIRSLEAERPPSVEALLQEGRGDIGTRSKELDQLPPNPEESQYSGVGHALGAPKRGLARIVQWITGRAPQTADNETWLDRLSNWASGVLNPQLQSERERELNRLMRMLDDDPDEGLKYALPMGGQSGRGVAPPGASLIPGNVDFRLNAPSGPVDGWSVPYPTHYQLTARYRELADREVRLGRYRRAAYIYAELLGDVHSAASVLRTGGHYREAAVLYQDKLNRPREAAECLESGGLYDEAIVIYEEIELYDTVGDLHRKLNRPDEAKAAYRKAVEKHQRTGGLLTAASLLEHKLDAPQEALEVLQSGWPSSFQARQCLAEEFQLHARMGRHDDAKTRITELADQPLNDDRTNSLLDVLTVSAGTYPDPAVRERAADTTRVVVSRELRRTRNPPRERKQLLVAAVQKLVPEDRLLKRDCQRFIRDEPPRKKPRTRNSRDGLRGIQPFHTRQLDSGVQWMTAVETNDAFYAAGYGEDELVLQSESWQRGEHPPLQCRWKIRDCRGNAILLAPDPFDVKPVWIQILGSEEPKRPQRIPCTSGTGRQVAAGAPPWGTPETVALAQTGAGPAWRISHGIWPTVNGFASDGTPIFSRQIKEDAEELIDMFESSTAEFGTFGEMNVPVHARADGVYFANFRELIHFTSRATVEQLRLPDRIVGLSGSVRRSKARIAISLPLGGVVHWSETGSQRRFGTDLSEPKTAFTATGKLVAVDERQIEVYDATRQHLTIETSGDSPGLPLAVMPVRRSEFAILDADGRLSLYRTAAA